MTTCEIESRRDCVASEVRELAERVRQSAGALAINAESRTWPLPVALKACRQLRLIQAELDALCSRLELLGTEDED